MRHVFAQRLTLRSPVQPQRIVKRLSPESNVQVGFSSEPTKKFHISLCTMFRDEAPYLLEWVAYHNLLGFDHFFLFDDNSTDNPLPLLSPLVKKGLVTVIPVDQTASNLQQWVFGKCSNWAARQTKWIANFDVDEFLHVNLDLGEEPFSEDKARRKLNRLMEDAVKDDEIAGFSLYRHAFGTSGESRPIYHTSNNPTIIDFLDEENHPKASYAVNLQTEKFISRLKMPKKETTSYWPKLLLRTDHTEYISNHLYRGKGHMVNGKGQPDCLVKNACMFPSQDNLSVFHYSTRSLQECNEKHAPAHAFPNSWRTKFPHYCDKSHVGSDLFPKENFENDYRMTYFSSAIWKRMEELIQ
jgi:hypothetical protein